MFLLIIAWYMFWYAFTGITELAVLFGTIQAAALLLIYGGYKWLTKSL